MSSEQKSYVEPRPGVVMTAKDFPQCSETYRAFPNSVDDEIVISGISGRFPKCENVEELAHNLYNKVCIITAISFYPSCILQRLRRAPLQILKNTFKCKTASLRMISVVIYLNTFYQLYPIPS